MTAARTASAATVCKAIPPHWLFEAPANEGMLLWHVHIRFSFLHSRNICWGAECFCERSGTSKCCLCPVHACTPRTGNCTKGTGKDAALVISRLFACIQSNMANFETVAISRVPLSTFPRICKTILENADRLWVVMPILNNC